MATNNKALAPYQNIVSTVFISTKKRHSNTSTKIAVVLVLKTPSGIENIYA
jgi:hypothetical protein